MGIIKGVLREELENSLRMKTDYQKALKSHPGGCFVRKNIKGHMYYYLAVRDAKKVRFIYKGKLSDEEVKGYEQAKEYRAKYRKLLSELKKQIKLLKGILRGKESV